MFERRPIWGLILGLNVCVLIWRISVQEPAMIEEEMLMTGAGGGVASGNGNIAAAAAAAAQQQHFKDAGNYYYKKLVQQQQQQQQQQQLYAGKHLLANQMSAHESSNAVHNEAEIMPRKTHKYELKTSLKEQEYLRKNSSSSSSSRNSSSNTNNNKISSKIISKNNNNNNNKNMNNKTLAISNMQNFMTKYAATPKPFVTAPTVLKLSQQRQQPQKTHAQHNNVTSDAFSLAAVKSLPATDRTQLIDLHNFSYTMLQPSCDADVGALILVHSAPRNYEKRAIIRETWGSLANVPSSSAKSHALRLLFLLGAVNDDELQQQLQQENIQHSDMIQGTFIDDYRNMTYKHVMAFKWFLYNCAPAEILIKVDDDVFVNTPQLLKYMQTNDATNVTTETDAAAAATYSASTTTTTTSTIPTNTFDADSTNASQFNAAQTLFQHPTNLLFCQEYIGSRVKRSYRSKWRVSFKEYAGRYYPPYCPGYAIIYSSDVVLRLYQAAQKANYFWIDDVHITGVLAQNCNISITTLMPYVLFSDKCESLLAGKTDLSHEEFLFAWHRISPTQIRAIWHLHLSNDNNSSSSALSSASSASASTTAFMSEFNYNNDAQDVSYKSYEHFS